VRRILPRASTLAASDSAGFRFAFVRSFRQRFQFVVFRRLPRQSVSSFLPRFCECVRSPKVCQPILSPPHLLVGRLGHRCLCCGECGRTLHSDLLWLQAAIFCALPTVTHLIFLKAGLGGLDSNFESACCSGLFGHQRLWFAFPIGSCNGGSSFTVTQFCSVGAHCNRISRFQFLNRRLVSSQIGRLQRQVGRNAGKGNFVGRRFLIPTLGIRITSRK